MVEKNEEVSQATEQTDAEAQMEAEVNAARERAVAAGQQVDWYVVHTYSGYEHKVKTNLEQRRESMGMSDFIFRVIVPENEGTKTGPNGEIKRVIENEFPGYVLVEMVMTDEAWFVIRNTPGVTGFLGSHGKGSKPNPMLPEEIDRILHRMGMVERHVEDIDIAVGEFVKIIGGPFAGMEGAVESIDHEKREITTILEVFGRETPAEISFDDIDKVY